MNSIQKEIKKKKKFLSILLSLNVIVTTFLTNFT